MYRTLLSAAVAVAMSATMVLAQNARIISLGTPTMQGVNMVEDVSDILYFPSDIALNTDMAQGAWNNHVFVTKGLMDLFTVGFSFGMPSYVTTTLGGGTSFDALLTTAMTGANTALPGSGSGGAVPGPGAGSFNLTKPIAPSNAGHLLIGMDLAGLSIGADLFREARNAKSESKDITAIGAMTRTISSDSTAKYGALGAILGAGMDLGSMQVKGAAGIVLRSYNGEVTYEGADVTGGVPTATYNKETSTLETKSGIHIPIYVKAKMDMGDVHSVIGMLNYSFNSAAFEATFDDGDAATAALDPYTSAGISNSFLGLSVADDMKIADNTHLIASIMVARASSKNTPETVDETTPEVTSSSVTFPAMTLGIEHTINSWWKFDEVILRAGGSKTVTWTSSKQEGGDELIDRSNAQAVSAFTWTTGLSLIKKNFELAMCVAPANWNSVYFIGGAGPTGTTVTMTYHFGNASPAPASGSSYDSYQTPSYETPSYSDPVDEDGLDF